MQSSTKTRELGPDLVRAVALLGVVVMNYHSYLNQASASTRNNPSATFAQRLFDPWEGPLSTRFAATFVLVAGVSVSLMTNSARQDGDKVRLSIFRRTLLYRGIVLYLFGMLLDLIWPGTIIFFYGAYFVCASLMVSFSRRWLLTIALFAALSSWAIMYWVKATPSDKSWLFDPLQHGVHPLKALVFNTFVNGTHPLFPWLAFFCVGMILGRSTRVRTRTLVLTGALFTSGTYLLSYLVGGSYGSSRFVLFSTHPFDRSLVYTLNALGTALIAYGALSWVAVKYKNPAIASLEVLGSCTLSVYVGHVLVFKLLVDQFKVITSTGLYTALVFALMTYLVLATLLLLWRRNHARGPAEMAYRFLADLPVRLSAKSTDGDLAKERTDG